MTDLKTETEVAIRAAVLDYAEGWYEGDAERMERCLHSSLVKRALKTDPQTGEQYLNHLTKEDMVKGTRNGGGTEVPRDKLYYQIEILEINQETAIVRCESALYIDYPQLINQGGQWLIVNVLYTNLNKSEGS